MKGKRCTSLVFCFISACILVMPALAMAQKPIELKMGSAFTYNRTTELGLRMFIERENKAAAGKLTIKYMGGPEAIPPFELIEAVRKGVVDLAGSPGSYYSAQVAEAGAMYLSRVTPEEERSNGAYALFNKVIAQKVNAYYLGRYNTTYKFNFYTKAKVEKMADFKGLKMRVSPVYRAFLKELDGVPIVMPHSEIYTALERGVVQGMGGTNFDIMDQGWHEQIKFIVDPPFYGSDTGIVVNLDTWNKLPEDLRKLMSSIMVDVEKDSGVELLKIINKEREDLVKYGIKVIPIAEPEKYVSLAYESAWKDVLEKSPQNGPELKELLSK